MGDGFEYGGQRLVYETYGDGPRLTVLLHGLLFSKRMHDELARALADRGHRVVTLDLTHGDFEDCAASSPASARKGARTAARKTGS